MDLTVDAKHVFAATGGHDFDPARPVVVFLHGSGMDHTVWQLQVRYFAWHGRSVLAVDMPGHGRSDGPALTTVEDMADWVFALLDAAGVERAALVGHSMGAAVALEAAGRQPDRVTAIALCGTAATMPVHPDLLKAAEAGEHVALDLIASWGLDRRAHLGGARAPGAWMMGGVVRLLEQGRDAVVGVDLRASNDYRGAMEAAARLRCPVLFVLGERDRMTPVKAARPLADAIDGARVDIIPQSGHMMMVEQPDRTLDSLRSIL